MPIVACSTISLQSRKPERPVRELGAAGWKRELLRLRSAGFAAVDLIDSWLAPAELDDRELTELRDVLQGCELAVAGLSVSRRSVIDPVDGDANLEYAHRTLDCAAFLGAPMVNVGFHRPLLPGQKRAQFWMVPGAADDRSDTTWQSAVERMRELAIHAQPLGLDLSLELYEESLLDSGSEAARMVHDVGESNVGVNADLGNLIRVPRLLDQGWHELLLDCLPHLNYWHVKNYIRLEHPATGTFMSYPTELGVGVIDYREAIRIALESGYEGPLCIEYYEGDTLETAVRSRRYLESLLADFER
jgi:sugar phosphate isomerase/epimerase